MTEEERRASLRRQVITALTCRGVHFVQAESQFYSWLVEIREAQRLCCGTLGSTPKYLVDVASGSVIGTRQT
jgi:hypothetical protein